jgi:dTDP-glucose 4,6-dehydratase
MNKREFKCTEILTDLIENEGLVGIKTSFEDEGATFNEVLRLKEICTQANVKVTLKIIKEYLGEVDYSSYIDMSFNRKGQDVRYALDDSKLRKLGWKPEANFDNELQSIIKYYKNKFIW